MRYVRLPGSSGSSGGSPIRVGCCGELHYPSERDTLLHLAVADRPLGVLYTIAWFFFPGPRHLAERYRLHAG